MHRFIHLLALLFYTAGAIADSFSPQVIKVYEEEEISHLEEEGVRILRRRGDILLCLVPTKDNNEIVIPNSIRKVKVNKRKNKLHSKYNVPTLDAAVDHFDAIDIINGKGFPQPYTGKGIVVGICDIGFDPLHPTFLDSEGKSRVRRVTQYKEREGIRLQLEGDEQYEEWGTDDPDNYHATHVCGILAGNGADSPYGGIARDADIVVSTSTLSDVGLLAGVEDIIDYAKETGKPAVINLSMGNYTGSHDGTSLFSQYLDMCADDAVIVLSSGNEGNRTNTLSYTFSDMKDNVEVRLGNSRWDQIEMYGITDIWGNDSTPLTVEISIYDEDNHKTVYTYLPFTLDNYKVEKIEWNPEDAMVEGCPLDGYMLVCGGIDPENGRHQTMLLYDFQSPEKVDGGWAKYVIAIKVSGTPGNSVDIFSDGTYTRLMAMPGNPAPNADVSVSDLACGHRVISVGMYGNPEAATIPYSSYGTLHDGRMLPTTVAPGYVLVSALNRHYLAEHPDTQCQGSSGAWIAEGGTSMASPYVAGFIATWLEAFPHMTVEDAMRLIDATNRSDIDNPDDPHNSNGWFDPVAAMHLAMDEASATHIKKDPREINPEDHITVYTVAGTKLYSGKAKLCPKFTHPVIISHAASHHIRF